MAEAARKDWQRTVKLSPVRLATPRRSCPG